MAPFTLSSELGVVAAVGGVAGDAVADVDDLGADEADRRRRRRTRVCATGLPPSWRTLCSPERRATLVGELEALAEACPQSQLEAELAEGLLGLNAS